MCIRAAVLVCFSIVFLSTAATAGVLPVDLKLHAGALVGLEDGSQSSLEGPEFLGQAALGVGFLGMFEVGMSAASSFGISGDATQVLLYGRYFIIPLPLVTPFVGVGAGYTWKEVSGDDWVHNDEGMAGMVEAGLELKPPFPLSFSFSGSLTAIKSDAHERNSSYPQWIPIWRLGLDVIYSF